MKKQTVYALAVLAALTTSCENKTESGALIGAGVGATAGALITGRGEGALVGGAIGAVGGGLIGYAMDEQDRNNLQQKSPSTLNKIDRGERLSTDDVKKMTAAGISDQVIISQIHSTGSVFHLSTADIIDLKNSGVSQNVIDAMVQTGNQ
jgi:outer membrane lipoprotein SlyB